MKATELRSMTPEEIAKQFEAEHIDLYHRQISTSESPTRNRPCRPNVSYSQALLFPYGPHQIRPLREIIDSSVSSFMLVDNRRRNLDGSARILVVVIDSHYIAPGNLQEDHIDLCRSMDTNREQSVLHYNRSAKNPSMQ